MSLSSEALRLLLAADADEIARHLGTQAEHRERLARWLAEARSPISIGDALFRVLLHDQIALPRPQVLAEYHEECRFSAGGFLPIPAQDTRWGMVEPVPDVYSTSQGIVLEAVLTGSPALIQQGRQVLRQMIGSLPVNSQASDTTLPYRKLSELLLQAHWCAAVAVIAPGLPADDVLLRAAQSAHCHAAQSEFSDRFATTLFRLSVMRRLPDFGNTVPTWSSAAVQRAAERLAAGDGVLEYRLEDKVDERAGSRSRSGRDQEHAWTYSSAYGAIVLSLWGLGDSDLCNRLRATLHQRLSNWPDDEAPLRIKEFVESLSPSATAYGALAALAGIFPCRSGDPR